MKKIFTIRIALKFISVCSILSMFSLPMPPSSEPPQSPVPFIAKPLENLFYCCYFLFLTSFPLSTTLVRFHLPLEAETVLVKDQFNIHTTIQCHFYVPFHSGNTLYNQCNSRKVEHRVYLHSIGRFQNYTKIKQHPRSTNSRAVIDPSLGMMTEECIW